MEKIYKCLKCGEKENLHFNYDYNQQHRPIKDVLCNDCGEVFEGNMPVDIFIAKAVSEYPELEGTMNLCEEIIQKRTGKMTEEEWQAAERAQTVPKDVVLGYKTSLDAQMLDSQLPKQENCCTTVGQIKRYVDCIGCDRKPKQETLEEVPIKLESVLAKINHQIDLGLSQWYEVVYYDGKWRSYSGSTTFKDGEIVVEWKYCKELF